MWSAPIEGQAQEVEREREAPQAAGAEASGETIRAIDPDVRRTAMARALFADGVEQAREGRFERAADFFRRAHALRPAPAVAYNLASALVQTGRLVEASEVLQWVLRQRETSPEMRAAARVTIARIAPRLARIRVVLTGAPGDVSLTLDARPLGLAVLGVMVPVDPGHHVVAAHRGEARVARAELELEESARREVVLVIPPPLAPPEPMAAAPPRDDFEWLLWGGVGVGVAAVIAVTIAIAVAAQPGPVAAVPGTTTPAILEWR